MNKEINSEIETVVAEAEQNDLHAMLHFVAKFIAAGMIIIILGAAIGYYAGYFSEEPIAKHYGPLPPPVTVDTSTYDRLIQEIDDMTVRYDKHQQLTKQLESMRLQTEELLKASEALKQQIHEIHGE